MRILDKWKSFKENYPTTLGTIKSLFRFTVCSLAVGVLSHYAGAAMAGHSMSLSAAKGLVTALDRINSAESALSVIGMFAGYGAAAVGFLLNGVAVPYDYKTEKKMNEETVLMTTRLGQEIELKQGVANKLNYRQQKISSLTSRFNFFSSKEEKADKIRQIVQEAAPLINQVKVTGLTEEGAASGVSDKTFSFDTGQLKKTGKKQLG